MNQSSKKQPPKIPQVPRETTEILQGSYSEKGPGRMAESEKNRGQTGFASARIPSVPERQDSESPKLAGNPHSSADSRHERNRVLQSDFEKPQSVRNASSAIGRFRPLKAMAWILAAGIGLCAVSTVTAAINGTLFYRTSSTETQASSRFGSMTGDEAYEVEPISVYVNNQNRPVVTYRFTKRNPGLRIYGIFGSPVIDGTMVGSIYLPDAGYTVDEFLLSTEIPYYAGEEEAEAVSLSDIGFTFDSQDNVDTDAIEDMVSYDGNAAPSAETLKRLYRAQFPYEFFTFNVEDTGTDSPSHTVVFTGKNDDGSADILYGNLNILFKKDGEVVYAGQEDMSNLSPRVLSDGTVEFRYSPPFSIPDYDSVEIVKLSD